MGAGAKPGERRGGRSKGTPNLKLNPKTQDLIATLTKLGYDPVAEIIKIGAIAFKEYERAEEIFDAIQDARADRDMVPLGQSEAPAYLKIAQKSATEIMPYLYPKRKSIELADAEGNNINESFCEMVAALVDRKNAKNKT